jgi:hypothetical protein
MMQQKHHHNGHSSAPRVNREQRMNLFFTEVLSVPESPASFSLSSNAYSNQMSSLWFGEPLSPPPK